MENHSIEGVRHVYSRACTIHLPKKPMVHMLWAAFEEQQGKSKVFPGRDSVLKKQLNVSYFKASSLVF